LPHNREKSTLNQSAIDLSKRKHEERIRLDSGGCQRASEQPTPPLPVAGIARVQRGAVHHVESVTSGYAVAATLSGRG
jgi:hypothetical protein